MLPRHGRYVGSLSDRGRVIHRNARLRGAQRRRLDEDFRRQYHLRLEERRREIGYISYAMSSFKFIAMASDEPVAVALSVEKKEKEVI